MKVESLHVYPLKSGRGFSVDSFAADERGFDGDRRLMVTDPDGNFLTQRTHPKLGWVDVRGAEDIWRFEAEGKALTVDVSSGPCTEVTVWSDTLEAVDCGDAAARWFTDLLETPARLVYMPYSTRRQSDVRHPSDNVELSFADACPYLVTTQESLADLNARIAGDDVPMAAFRPSIVLSGAPAWDEDNWRILRIGDATFDAVKPCTRCKITTLDPERPGPRGRRDGEPLRTLATFRRDARGEVMFGMYFVCRSPGVTISTSDAVEVLK